MDNLFDIHCQKHGDQMMANFTSHRAAKMHRVIPLIIAGVIGGLSGARADTEWTNMTRRYVQSCAGAKTRWTLCGLSYIVQREPSTGGPQDRKSTRLNA